MKTKPYTFVTVTLTAVAGILCIWALHKYVESPVSTPVPEVNVHNGYYNQFGTNREENRGPFILTMEFLGQQGAGMHALISQQCFVSNLDIPAYIVEPFVINSVFRHTYPNTRDRKTLIKFSDLFNFDAFDAESIKSGYGPLVRWEQFLNSGSSKAILVELQSGGQKGTDVVWDGYSTQDSPCYKDKQYPKHRNVINSTLCLVRIVRLCCVHSANLNQLSTPGTIMTMKQLRHGIFGNWKSEKVTILFNSWGALLHIPATCQHSFEGKIFPSEQVLKFANQYRDTFLKSNKVVAFVLHFEHLILRNYNVDVCLKKFRQAHNSFKGILTDASVFVAADLGRYQSGSWGYTFSISGIDHKRGEQIQSTFINAFSDFIRSQWKFDEWENSFDQITGGIKDAGYIAAVQKSIASKADCLVFLTKGESAFQDLVKQEYIKYHPTVSEQCIHYLCTKDCPNCTHFYSKRYW